MSCHFSAVQQSLIEGGGAKNAPSTNRVKCFIININQSSTHLYAVGVVSCREIEKRGVSPFSSICLLSYLQRSMRFTSDSDKDRQLFKKPCNHATTFHTSLKSLTAKSLKFHWVVFEKCMKSVAELHEQKWEINTEYFVAEACIPNWKFTQFHC